MIHRLIDGPTADPADQLVHRVRAERDGRTGLLVAQILRHGFADE